jgi:hypothetical protein
MAAKKATPSPTPTVKKSPKLTIEERKRQERARIKKLQEAERDRLSPSNMTPAEKAAFLERGRMGY